MIECNKHSSSNSLTMILIIVYIKTTKQKQIEPDRTTTIEAGSQLDSPGKVTYLARVL